METKRQKQVAGEVQHALSEILQKHGRNYYGSSFVTISGVKVTPDLLVARTYISVFQENERKGVIDALTQNTSEIRKHLGNMMRNQLRRVPELEFYLDESLDDVFKIENLLKQSKEQQSPEKNE